MDSGTLHTGELLLHKFSDEEVTDSSDSSQEEGAAKGGGADDFAESC